jgi:uroporphyrinogen III methyltransferase/synthase
VTSPARAYLVGAGPGDPGLLTARALELIATADVILYDRLIPASALAGARAGAELIYVGKEGGGPSMPQAEIEQRLLEHAQAGRTVVRLKGGDPFVFGRGGEEAEALAAAGIPFEVVPGVTAGVAAPAYAGIPVTHRDGASAVAFLTGHEDPAKPESALDWSALAWFPGTLVVYMGVRQLAAIAERLLAGGRAGDEPAAVVERGTLADQRVVSGTLATIAERALAEDLRAPAIAVFGPVVAARERLQWFEHRPLAGLTVAVTRARAQASTLADRLRSLGAVVIEIPAIRIAPIDGPVPELERYDLLCLTSPNGVRLLFERLASAGRDARALAGTRVAAIGPGTAAALVEHGVIADVVPERFVAEGLVEALAGVPVTRALIARATEARDVLPDALRARGATVDVIALYETVAETLTDGDLAAARAADYVTFTSSSTVRFFFEAVESAYADSIGSSPGGEHPAAAVDSAYAIGSSPGGEHPAPPPALGARLVSIGPVTSEALRRRGLEPHVEASRHDIDGLVEAVLGDAAREAQPR